MTAPPASGGPAIRGQGRLFAVLIVAVVALVASQIVGLIGLRRRGEELVFSGALLALWLVSVVAAGLWFEGVG